MNSAEVKQRVTEFVAKAYASALAKIKNQNDEDLANLKERLAMKGLLHSSVMERESAKLSAEMVTALVQAKVNAAAEAYEMYGTLDNEAIENIISDAREMHAQAVAALSGSASHQAQNIARRTGSDIYAAQLTGHNFAKDLGRLSTPILNEIVCQLERRRHLTKNNPDSAKTTNVYHVYGLNPHLNINSSDHSVNTVTLTNEQVFTKLKEKITADVLTEERGALLNRLQELEQAQNTPSFGHKYSEFIAVAANHMGLIAPFIPALTEMLQKVLT